MKFYFNLVIICNLFFTVLLQRKHTGAVVMYFIDFILLNVYLVSDMDKLQNV